MPQYAIFSQGRLKPAHLQEVGALHAGRHAGHPVGQRGGVHVSAAPPVALLQHAGRQLAEQPDQAARCRCHLLVPELLVQRQVLQCIKILSAPTAWRHCRCAVRARSPTDGDSHGLLYLKTSGFAMWLILKQLTRKQPQY